MCKKGFLMIITLALLSGMFSGVLVSSATVKSIAPVKGSIDDPFTINDARAVLQHVVGKIILPAVEAAKLKQGGEGDLSIADARIILQILVGKADPPEPNQEPEPEPEPELLKYPVREVNEMPDGTAVVLKNVENLGHVPGWEPSEAVIVRSVEELRVCGIDLSAALAEKYDAAFFEENAVIVMNMPVGHANVNHQIDSLVRTGDELCLGTTIYWTEGADMTKRVTWRFAFEVDKADVAGVETVRRYTFDERDKVWSGSPIDINSNFTDDTVLVYIKSSYSHAAYQLSDEYFTPDAFPDLDVENVKIVAVSWPGNIRKNLMMSLTLETKNKQHVIWAISRLKKMDIILYAIPNYYIVDPYI